MNSPCQNCGADTKVYKECDWYNGEWISKDQYEAKLKAEREKIAEDVADKMDYMGSCLNEKNIILGIITGKRETLNSLCSTCKSESCVSNGTAISKADYETRLKADKIAMLKELQVEIENIPRDVNDLIQQKIDSLKVDKEKNRNNE